MNYYDYQSAISAFCCLTFSVSYSFFRMSRICYLAFSNRCKVRRIYELLCRIWTHMNGSWTHPYQLLCLSICYLSLLSHFQIDVKSLECMNYYAETEKRKKHFLLLRSSIFPIWGNCNYKYILPCYYGIYNTHLKYTTQSLMYNGSIRRNKIRLNSVTLEVYFLTWGWVLRKACLHYSCPPSGILTVSRDRGLRCAPRSTLA